jgi:hypothetical protein
LLCHFLQIRAKVLKNHFDQIFLAAFKEVLQIRQSLITGTNLHTCNNSRTKINLQIWKKLHVLASKTHEFVKTFKLIQRIISF